MKKTIPAAIPCRECMARLTWAEDRRQFGRLIQRGLTPDEAKQAMPRCGKCVTSLVALPVRFGGVSAGRHANL